MNYYWSSGLTKKMKWSHPSRHLQIERIEGKKRHCYLAKKTQKKIAASLKYTLMKK